MCRVHGYVPPRHVIRIDGREYPCYRDLLEVYLVQHPRRRAALELALPGAADRLRGAWRVANGRLMLERLWLTEDHRQDDELVWHILFTGLKKPLTAFWVDSLVACPLTEDAPRRYSPLLHIPVSRGTVDERKIREARPKEIRMPSMTMYQAPLVVRLLFVVLGNLACWPAAIIHVFHPLMDMDDPWPVRLKHLLVLPAYQVVESWNVLRGKEDDGTGFPLLRRIIAWYEGEQERASFLHELDDMTREALRRRPPGSGPRIWGRLLSTGNR